MAIPSTNRNRNLSKRLTKIGEETNVRSRQKPLTSSVGVDTKWNMQDPWAGKWWFHDSPDSWNPAKKTYDEEFGTGYFDKVRLNGQVQTKLNAAYANGGFQTLISTIQKDGEYHIDKSMWVIAMQGLNRWWMQRLVRITSNNSRSDF